jgi:ankyrin repeat protein
VYKGWLDSQTYNLEPPLHVAIRCLNGRRLISLFLENGANINTAFRDVRPLALAIHHSGKPPENLRMSSTDERIVSRTEVVKQLIEKGADVNRRSVIEGVRLTPLQQACKYGLSPIERLLLAHGALERKTTTRRKVRRKSTRRVDAASDSSLSLVDD